MIDGDSARTLNCHNTCRQDWSKCGLYQPEGLWGMSANNAKLIVLVPDEQGGVPMHLSQNVRAILVEAQKRQVTVEQIKVAA
jgi:hypothetical protein